MEGVPCEGTMRGLEKKLHLMAQTHRQTERYVNSMNRPSGADSVIITEITRKVIRLEAEIKYIKNVQEQIKLQIRRIVVLNKRMNK